MEDPLELLASADWIKDYDPLFELFDEEMGATSADIMTPTTTDMTHNSIPAVAEPSTAPWSNNCCTTVQDPYAANNCVDPLIDLNQHLFQYHYQSYYHQQHTQQMLIHTNHIHQQSQQSPQQNQPTTAACKQQQTDELSVILGLDWTIPYLSEYNSPTESSSSSAYSSAAPSPAATLSASSLSSTEISCNNNTTTTINHQGVIYVPKYHIPINNVAVVTPKTNDKITTTKNTTATRIIVQNYDISTQINDISSSNSRHLVDQTNNNHNKSTDNSNCNSALKKRRKKCMRLNRGISLLAQPAPSRQISKHLAKLCITIEHSYAAVEPPMPLPMSPPPSSVAGNDSTPKPKCDCHK